jgi:predicted site-specific integrase-resolvase
VRTTTRPNWSFVFTISDLGRLLGKSPVTLRGWEDRGFVDLPRDPSGDRKLSSHDVRRITEIARNAGRISQHRANLVAATMTLIEQIEAENNWKAKQ